jgi:hypothetical protein
MSMHDHHTPTRTPDDDSNLGGGHPAHTHDPAPGQGPQNHAGHGGHRWMMLACCVPMLVIAIVLVATGVVGSGFIVVALACTAMMAMMMRGMGGSGHDH